MRLKAIHSSQETRSQQELAGRRVSALTFIQYGPDRVREKAKRRGYDETLRAAGVSITAEPG